MMTPFAEVKSSLPAETVLAHFLGPSRSRQFSCPFHDDKNPSMSAKDGGIRCWSCGWSGDIFRFVRDHQEVSTGDSLRICADLAGVVLPERTAQDGDGRRLRLPSLARSYAGVLRETTAIEDDILYQGRKAAGLAWRQAWGARRSEVVWDAVEIGVALDREIAVMEMGAACDG